MLVSDIKLGLKVRVSTNDMEAMVVGRPEYYSPTAKLVRIKYENSTRFEHVTNHMIEPLPIEQQAKQIQNDV